MGRLSRRQSRNVALPNLQNVFLVPRKRLWHPRQSSRRLILWLKNLTSPPRNLINRDLLPHSHPLPYLTDFVILYIKYSDNLRHPPPSKSYLSNTSFWRHQNGGSISLLLRRVLGNPSRISSPCFNISKRPSWLPRRPPRRQLHPNHNVL